MAGEPSAPGNSSALSEEAQQDLVDVEEDIAQLLANLRQGNQRRESSTRSERMQLLEQALKDLETAWLTGDEVLIRDVRDVWELARSITECEYEAALIEWSALYAEMLDEVGAVAEGRQSLLNGPLNMAWARATRGTKRPVPAELREAYAVLLIAKTEGMLAWESTRLRPLIDLRVLNSDDVSRWRVAPAVFGVARSSAEESVAAYRRQEQLLAAAQQAAEEADPGFIVEVVQFAGWDSFTDFALDVGIIVATGGGGAFVKWGRTLNRSIRVLRRAEKAAMRAETLRKDVRRIEKYREAVRQRLQATRVGSPQRQALKASRSRLTRQMRELTEAIKDLEKNLKTPEQIKELKEVVDEAVKAAVRNVVKTGSAPASQVAVREIDRLGIVGLSPAAFHDLTVEEVQKLSAQWGIDNRSGLGRRIGDAQDDAVHCIGAKAGNKRRLFQKWLYLLITRQVIVRTSVQLARNGLRLPSRAELAEIVVKSVVSAVEEIFREVVLRPLKLGGGGEARDGGEREVNFVVQTLVRAITGTVQKVAAEIVVQISLPPG